jgi:exodeoxyribonuclease VII large subunit
MREMFPPQNTAVPETSVLTVSGLNRLAKSLLEGHFPSVTVEGEISNLSRPSSGHWYFTLKDQTAQLRCAMFAGANRRVRFSPEGGQQVTVRGRLSLYEGRGDYQLIVDFMTEAGAGALQRAFELLKAKLEDEGLFEAQRKKPLRDDYAHVGIITSATGAAVQDIISVFGRRSPRTTLTLIPVSVQGSQAPAEIVEAIARANRLAASLGIEALIVGRGGGSIEDLQAFNEESVARAITASALPICSAVGHETDFTIADFVADLRAPTPSAAAEQLSQNQEDQIQLFAAIESQLLSRIQARLQSDAKQVAWLARRLKRPDRHLQEQAQHLDRLETRAQRAWTSSQQRRGSALSLLESRLQACAPSQRLTRLTLQLADMQRRLSRSIGANVASKANALSQLGRSLDTVSPLNTLARGYSLSYDASGGLMRSVSTAEIGDKLETRVSDGLIVSTIQTIAKA